MIYKNSSVATCLYKSSIPRQFDNMYILPFTQSSWIKVARCHEPAMVDCQTMDNSN
jgi:hypothetical protein